MRVVRLICYLWGALLCIVFHVRSMKLELHRAFIIPITMFKSVTFLAATLFVLRTLFLVSAEDECPADRQHPVHDEGRLHNDLLCGYQSLFRPVKDHRTAVNVSVRFALKYVTFDSLEEMFTIHSWVALTWKDEFLSWTPSNYGDISEIQIESLNIWTPRMSLYNADASQYQSDSIYTTCSITSSGVVSCVPHLSHSGICRTSLRKWPYDHQNCTLFFGSWMNTGEQVNFTLFEKKPVVLDDYQDGPAWKLLNVVSKRLPGKYDFYPNSTYPILKYTFIMQREAAGPAAIVVVPSVVIVLLTLTSVLLDIKDNTRLMLACFSLFGHYVFLTEIGYNIPKHSADTPIILLFIRDSMLVTLSVILVTLFLMSLRRRVTPPPAWIMTVSRLGSNGPARYVVFTEFDASASTEGKILTEDGPSSDVNEQQSRATKDWILFANIFNSFVFIISFLTYLVLIFAYIPYSD